MGYFKKSGEIVKESVVMKPVKKYYLVPENRYKILNQQLNESTIPKSQPDEEIDLEKKTINHGQTKASSSLVSPLISDPIREQNGGENYELSKQQKPEIPLKSQPTGPTRPPPPGIPVRIKRKRALPWVSL